MPSVLYYVASVMHIPPAPKWNPAVDGLDMGDFVRSAREFERSRLPGKTVFPREGEVWRAVRDSEVGFMAWFTDPLVGKSQQASLAPNQAPFFPCGTARLRQGEKVRILPLDDPKPLTVMFLPLRYAELEPDLVPEHIRQWPAYSTYQLTAPTARTFGFEKVVDYFTDCFEKVEDPAPGS